MSIITHLENIVKTIVENEVVSVVASTGTGKSTLIPGAIAANGLRCMVSVPTKIAALSLYNYQKVLQNDTTKLSVGYAAEGDIQYNDSTKIIYATSGHIRRLMLKYIKDGVPLPMTFCNVLFVDETHTGSTDVSTILALWQYTHDLNIKVPKLLLASATPTDIKIKPDPVNFSINTNHFNVDVKYLDKDDEQDSVAMYNHTAEIIYNIHKTEDISKGHLLAFAPGEKEVQTIYEHLEYLLSKNPIENKTAFNIVLYSNLKQEDIKLIYEEAGPTERKIIIATNIAETSITIQDIGFVVDTMLEKRVETSMSGGIRLSTQMISKDSANQRKGRTGRTIPGKCYRMCTLKTYEQLDDHRPLEITRIPIYDLVMELLDVGLEPNKVIKEIDNQKLIDAIQLLNRLGMIEYENKNIKVTDKGHFAPYFPLSVKNSAFLWDWVKEGYAPFPGVVIASIIDSYGPSFFWVPKEANVEELFGDYIGYSDLESSLNMWDDLYASIGTINSTSPGIPKWSFDRSMNNKKIKELLQIISKCMGALSSLYKTKLPIDSFNPKDALNASKPLLSNVYSDSILYHKIRNEYQDIERKLIYKLNNKDAINLFSTKYPKAIIALSSIEIKSGRGIMRVVSFALDTDKTPIITTKPDSSVDVSDALNLLDNITLPTKTKQDPLYEEYMRFWYINKIKEDSITIEPNYTQQILKCINNWITLLAYDSEPLFTTNKLSVSSKFTLYLLDELKKYSVPNVGNIVGTCIGIGQQFLSLNSYENIKVKITNDNIIIGQFESNISPEHIKYFKTKLSNNEIARIVMRYSIFDSVDLFPNGFYKWLTILSQQKSLPLIDCFTTPLVVKTVLYNPSAKYCSFYPDIDKKLGNIGPFTTNKIKEGLLFVQSPNIQIIHDQLKNDIINTIKNNSTVSCIFVSYIQSDDLYNMSKSIYLKTYNVYIYMIGNVFDETVVNQIRKMFTS